ncbi:hypothetical protein GCM10009530_44920 [Microbispora corallina]|uniref:Glyoxalase-like domain-containing protein n=1 Tax=Microbispora corallina TaxID=83302 RepID=A0ABQ4FWR0_9ACTN|nr:VOC family protein [Microbispora corallina]GIH39249.1 hypothetical protein Mco01_22490 [Microbispora corallina]
MVRWIWVFVDRPRERFEESAAFWTAVTGARLSARRGDDREFATLLPPEGDACVKLQGVREGDGAHLDLEVDDVRAAVAGALDAGAAVVADHGEWAVLRSPGGQAFCLGPWSGAVRRPSPVEGSRLDQICLDVRPPRTTTRSRSGRR